MDTPHMFEYTSAVVPTIGEISPNSFSAHHTDAILTPTLCANFIHFQSRETVEQNISSASNHVFYVLDGKGDTHIPDCGTIQWSKGDVFSLPACEGIKHIIKSDSILFHVSDEPLLRFLNATPKLHQFAPTHYKSEEMLHHIKVFNSDKYAQKRNRNGILLSNSQMVSEGLNTVTRTLWCLLNTVSPNTTQSPHRHNSIAIDLCIKASESGNVYTLMGKRLNENGEIVDPIKMIWKSGHVFITPPGWWHSHHNDSDEIAWVFPVQDAGIHTYTRTLDIRFQSSV